METTIILAQKQNRLNNLLNNGKNIKSAGVVRKIIRQIRAIEKSLS